MRQCVEGTCAWQGEGLNYRLFVFTVSCFIDLGCGTSSALLSTRCSGVSQVFGQGTLKDLDRVRSFRDDNPFLVSVSQLIPTCEGRQGTERLDQEGRQA